ncbi:hypothetical protein [uncultured Thiodictyon sp.]|uniref:hypothetical protein n=1 Tax=uncultured Thiodictyon sp. TaxID=1846217 RepID=UPI0025F0D061|nr:hypothetical protein [uncultured Thiodictyon sp.]
MTISLTIRSISKIADRCALEYLVELLHKKHYNGNYYLHSIYIDDIKDIPIIESLASLAQKCKDQGRENDTQPALALAGDAISRFIIRIMTENAENRLDIDFKTKYRIINAGIHALGEIADPASVDLLITCANFDFSAVDRDYADMYPIYEDNTFWLH